MRYQKQGKREVEQSIDRRNTLACTLISGKSERKKKRLLKVARRN